MDLSTAYFHLTGEEKMPEASMAAGHVVLTLPLSHGTLTIISSEKYALGFEQMYEWAHSIVKAVEAKRLDWVDEVGKAIHSTLGEMPES